MSAGSHPHVCRIVKGVFEQRPALPHYADTWDVNTVLNTLKLYSPLEKLSLKELTLKTAMLLSLVTGQRGHAIHASQVTDFTFSHSKCTASYSQKHKTTPALGFTPLL